MPFPSGGVCLTTSHQPHVEVSHSCNRARPYLEAHQASHTPATHKVCLRPDVLWRWGCRAVGGWPPRIHQKGKLWSRVMLYDSKQLRVLANFMTAISCLSSGECLLIAQSWCIDWLCMQLHPLWSDSDFSALQFRISRLEVYWIAHLQGYDLIEDMYSAKTAAMNLVAELCKQRGKASLEPFMHFIVQVMTEYQVAYLTSTPPLSPWFSM